MLRRRTIVSVTESHPIRLPVAAPDVAAPPRFMERRLTSRREEDRIVHQETRLLAGALDELAGQRSAEARLAAVLALIARVVGARRAAVLRQVSLRFGPYQFPRGLRM